MKRIGLFCALLFLVSMSFAQFSLTGVVKDENGEPLPGANVLIDNTFNGIAT